MRIAAVLPEPTVTKWVPTAGVMFGMHLCLAHKVLQSQAYQEAYLQASRRGEYVILDNGAAENGASLGAEELLHAAALVEAKEIVAPDILEDSSATIDLTEAFIDSMLPELKQTRLHLMIVPQGKTGYEWQICAQTLYGLLHSRYLSSRVVIGVPKHLDRKVTGGRAAVLTALVGAWRAPHKFHLLGSGEYLCRDIIAAKQLKQIRSLDSSLPAALAQHNRRLTVGLSRNGVLCDFESSCDEFLLGLNLLEVRKWMSREWICPRDVYSKLPTGGCVSCPLTNAS